MKIYFSETTKKMIEIPLLYIFSNLINVWINTARFLYLLLH